MNILLTSVGRRTYMLEYFKNALTGLGKVYASNSVLTYSMTCADGYVLTPKIYDSSYIQFLLEYCNDNHINAIIPLFDIDLPILAKNKDVFKEQGIDVVVSDYNVTQTCNDKWKTYQFLKSLNIQQVATFINIDDVKFALCNKTISYPLILKPRWGMGSIGIYTVNNENELDVLYQKLQKEIFDTYLKYESAEDVSACVLIQEKILGQEFGLDVLNDLNKQYVTCVAKKKIAMRSGETDIAQIIDNQPFLKLAKNISESLQHIGNLDVDCFITNENDLIVLEMNCRFGGQYPFSHNAGVDFPKQIIEWILNKPTSKELITHRTGVISCKDIEIVELKTK